MALIICSLATLKKPQNSKNDKNKANTKERILTIKDFKWLGSQAKWLANQ